MDKIYDYILQKESHIGLLRPNQEDAVLTLVHPEDDRYKILAVCDGMGGKQYGDIAANYVIQKFGYWFLKHPSVEFSDIIHLKEEMKDLVMECNQYLINQYGKNQVGTTLTLALILLEDTILVHLGDSRAYTYQNDAISQVTEDDSDVWLFYKYHQVEKEWLRYFSTSNIIHNCIGISLESCRPHVYVISNQSYQSLLLTTDGVTDLVTDSKLQHILREEDSSFVCKKIIEEAIFANQHLFVPSRLMEKKLDCYVVPVQGRDNASAVFFSKI